MKNTKNVYEALNEVDFDFEDYEKEVLSDMEKKKLKDKFNKNKRKRFNFKKVSSIVAAGLIDGTDNLFFATYDADLKFSNIKDIKLDEDIDIKIVLKDIRSLVGVSNETVITKGKWKFEFKANGKELNEGTYALPMDYSFNVDNQKYSLNEFTYNPIKQKIYGSIENMDIDNYNDIKLRGYDDLGNEVEFERSISNKGEVIFEYSNIDGDLSDQSTSITLVPYSVEFPKENGTMSNDFRQVGEEFTIVLNKSNISFKKR
ncbi:MAG TPA: hypothetical protein GX707_04060 [Epulopiscium sp.]|nr:hypothetical protein [Candidatus Epulonipiscium sp.]